MSVACPYCGQPAKLVDSATVYHGRSYGMIWDCRPCDAYVGVHKNSRDFKPLGRLANRELRGWKQRAHAAFDPLWLGLGAKMKRWEAYAFMQQAMGLTSEDAHIGKFTVEDCKNLVSILTVKSGVKT